MARPLGVVINLQRHLTCLGAPSTVDETVGRGVSFMARRHKWKPHFGVDRCQWCHLYRKPNPAAATRPLYSTDNGARWDTTEFGYVPPCIEPREREG